MALEPLFDDICAAIHEKDGKTDGIMARDFPARIRAIPAGGTEPTGPGWHRPSNWPDYSKISLDGFEGMYFTYDTSRAASDPTEFCAFTVTTQGSAPYLVERGQIVGGAFVAEESSSVGSGTKFAEWLAQTESGYVVYRVTSDAPITNIQMSPSDKYDEGERTSYTQFCVERYGRIPNVTRFLNWRLSYVVSDTIIDCKKLTDLAGCWQNCYNLVSLDLSGWDTSAVTNLNNCWYGCTSLMQLKFCPIPISFALSASPNLTVTSLLNVLENLPIVETRQTATIGAANKAKLTDEQIAAAAEKGWNVA